MKKIIIKYTSKQNLTDSFKLLDNNVCFKMDHCLQTHRSNSNGKEAFLIQYTSSYFNLGKVTFEILTISVRHSTT